MSSNSDTPNKVGAALVVGGGIGGMQAALDLGAAGYKVFLVEEKSAIGGRMAQLDKTFPTNDCSMCTISPRLVDVDKHPNIEILTNAEVMEISGEAGNFHVDILKHPRYVDMEKCNACGDCLEVCPVETPDLFDEALRPQKAIYKLYPQAIPNKMAIHKAGVSPCKAACPSHVHVQGYLALARRGKYKEALNLIRKDCALPSVCGRVCVRFCEDKCLRGRIDEAVAINDVKWFLSEQPVDDAPPEKAPAKNRKVAVIGAGPAGLGCAYYLALDGYDVSVFEKEAEPGGVLRYGIPEYRLPRAALTRDIDYIRKCGVDIRCSTSLGDQISIEGLQQEGYEAIFLALGCSHGARLGIEGESARGVIQGIDFLKSVAQGNAGKPGDRAIVVGGGNVAVDAARTLVRLGTESVTILYRRSREDMPAYDEEVEAALDEGVRIETLLAPAEVVVDESGRVKGLKCVRMELGEPDKSGRRRPIPIEGSEFLTPCDSLIPAIGQIIEPSLWDNLPGVESRSAKSLRVDHVTYETSAPGVFAGGDVGTGPRTVIEALAAGKEAAESIRRMLEGEDLREGRNIERPIAEQPKTRVTPAKRRRKSELPSDRRKGSFDETHIGFDEEDVSAEASRCLSCGICSECLECARVCQPKAILHGELPERKTLDVGSVILVPGFETFDATLKAEYGYGRMSNVLTSMEFERLLSASGPTEGQVVRPSDSKHPEKIAWIQCVGSRDVTCDRDYCSSVCCMYATKEAIIAREHDSRIQPTIFYNDIRAFGKGFEIYYENASSIGVRYAKGIVSTVKEQQQTKDLALTYPDENGAMTSEVFEMVVLSVGLGPSESAKRLAERLGIDLNRFGFAETGDLTPNRTSREGIFVAGAFEAPMDIPESVMGASSAAALSGELLGDVRKTLVKAKSKPEERDVSAEAPRIGVFVCHCGSNIARIVDVPQVTQYARSLPNVVLADHNLFTCSSDSTAAIARIVRENGINRVVVASCSPRTHEPLFRDVCAEAGINRYLFEMANIRDQCSWVHQSEPEAATEKAKDLVRMAVARAAKLEPIREHSFPVIGKALVVGGGLAGMTAALSIADQGFQAVLVEREAQLGGMGRRHRLTLSGLDVEAFAEDLSERVLSHPGITVYRDSELVDFSGHVGRFSYTVRNISEGDETALESGAVIIATGGREHEPDEYLRGVSDKVWTQVELGVRIHDEPSRLDSVKDVVMIQCVGSREPSHMYCSRVCCSAAINNALALKERDPSIRVFVLHRDIRTYGFNELFYRQARESGVIFIPYTPDRKPVVEEAGDKLKVTVFSKDLGDEVELPADRVILSAAIRPHPQTDALGALMKLPRNDVGFFMEAHMKLRPLDFASEGIFLCGLAHGPKHISESLSQAKGAAARAATVLSKEVLQVSGEVSVIDPRLCASCLTCVRLCPFGVPAIDPETGRAHIEAALCQGCGVCAGACPRKAIRLQHHTDVQLLAKVAAL